MSTLKSDKRKLIKKALKKRDGFLCFYCGVGFNYDIRTLISTIDHKVPECRGGTHDLFNLCLSCYTCNNKKGMLTLEEFLVTDFLICRRLLVLNGNYLTDLATA